MILAGTPSLVDLIDIPISLIAWSGLYAFVHRKKFSAARLWQVWFFVIVIWDITYNVFFDLYLGIGQKVEDVEPTTALCTLTALIFLVPEYVALYLYGCKGETIWNESRP